MRLDIYDTTRHETRSGLKPWYPRVLHAACASEPADWLRADWMREHYSPKGSGDCSEVKTQICIRTWCNGRTCLARHHLDVLHHIRLYWTSQIISAKVRMGSEYYRHSSLMGVQSCSLLQNAMYAVSSTRPVFPVLSKLKSLTYLDCFVFLTWYHPVFNLGIHDLCVLFGTAQTVDKYWGHLATLMDLRTYGHLD